MSDKPSRSLSSLWAWLTRLLSGHPHSIVGGTMEPYLLRWYLIPRNPWLNIYLHKFLKDDDDRALHDHPWWFVSVMLWGRYFEHTEHGVTLRQAPSVAFRRATDRHRISLSRMPCTWSPIPCWTLVVTGRKSRTWGFWCDQGKRFVPWFEFVDRTDNGSIGTGCGDDPLNQEGKEPNGQGGPS